MQRRFPFLKLLSRPPVDAARGGNRCNNYSNNDKSFLLSPCQEQNVMTKNKWHLEPVSDEKDNHQLTT